MKNKLVLLLVIILFIVGCINQPKKETISDSIQDSKSCIKNFKIVRSENPGLDGMEIELIVSDTVYQLICERKIIGFKPIHKLMPLYPKGTHSRVNINFDSTNHIFKMGQGTIEFFKYESNELDSIQKLIMQDLIVVLFDKDSNEYKVFPCE